MSNEGTAVAQVAPLKQALALATEAGDINALRDVAAMGAALQKGAKARGLGIESENQAAEVVIRAERAIGHAVTSLRAEGKLAGWGGHGRNATPGSPRSQYAPDRVQELDLEVLTINDILPNVHPQVVSNFQALAAIPDSVFEDKVAGLLATGQRFAKLDFYRLVKGGEKAQKQAQADIREALHADDETREFAVFRKAATALLFSALPDDELAKVAVIIRGLVDTYGAERMRRQQRAA